MCVCMCLCMCVCVCVCVCVCAGIEAIWELSVPFDQFLCKPETSLKNKVHWLKILNWDLAEDKIRWFGGEHGLLCCAVFSRSVVSDSLQPHGLCVARQAPLCMGFSRQEYWGGLPGLPPGERPNLGIEHKSSTLQVDSLLFALFRG